MEYWIQLDLLGYKYTGSTDISGNEIIITHALTSSNNVYINTNYKVGNNGGTFIGNDGSNGADDTGNPSAVGGAGGNSGLYYSSGNLTFKDQNNNLIIWDWAGSKFINRYNGAEITNGNAFKYIGKGGDGGKGESSSGNDNASGSAGANGAVLIIEYAVLPQ